MWQPEGGVRPPPFPAREKIEKKKKKKKRKESERKTKREGAVSSQNWGVNCSAKIYVLTI